MKIGIHDALGVLISAAETRKAQIEGLGQGKEIELVALKVRDTASLRFDTGLWGDLDTKDSAAIIEAAIDKVRIFRDSAL